MLAVELTAWLQLLALHDHGARRWDPQRLRYRLFTVPAALARTGRRVRLHLADRSPWAQLVADTTARLRTSPSPPTRPPPSPTSRSTRTVGTAPTERPRRNGRALAAPSTKVRGNAPEHDHQRHHERSGPASCRKQSAVRIGGALTHIDQLYSLHKGKTWSGPTPIYVQVCLATRFELFLTPTTRPRSLTTPIPSQRRRGTLIFRALTASV